MRLVPEINNSVLEKTIKRARERNIVLPTFAQQKDPTLVPDDVRKRLEKIGLWDVDPANLFRITWKNEAVEHGGNPALAGFDMTADGAGHGGGRHERSVSEDPGRAGHRQPFEKYWPAVATMRRTPTGIARSSTSNRPTCR